MRGSLGQEEQSAKEMELLRSKKKKAPTKAEAQESTGDGEKEEIQRRKSTIVLVQGKKSLAPPQEDERRVSLFVPSQEIVPSSASSMAKTPEQIAQDERDKAEVLAQQEAAMKIAERKAKAKPEASPLSQLDIGSFGRKIIGFLTRNFFNMKNVALFIAFMINLLLLFYKASAIESESGDDDDDDNPEEWIHVEEESYYVEHIINVFAII